ncbi:MAG: M55 family metallopeptidase [Oligoflexia bacterium]|nr:M55 family metallopeptidase [Oligoflexia bacterium]
MNSINSMNSMNRYLISVDIEGITGVANREFSSSNGSRYSLACYFMICDVNAVIKGIFSADKNPIVIVRDAHGKAVNLDLAKLDSRAQLLQGWDSSTNMVYPVDDSYSGVFLVGYHSGATNLRGVLSHTYGVRSVKINGMSLTETGIAAWYAGHYNVPIIFCSGDDQAVIEAKEQLPQIEIVEVKKSINRHSSLSLSLDEATKKLEAGAFNAVKRNIEKKLPPLIFKEKLLKVIIEFEGNSYLPNAFQDLMDILSFDLNYKFNNENLSVEYQTSSQLEAYQRFALITKLASAFVE